MPTSYTSVHGKRLGILSNGMLQVDGNTVGPNINSFGKVIYVDSVTGAAGSSGLTPADAISTIDAAVAKCTATKGDIIAVLPGHTETISAAAGIALDVAGITVIGLGRGSQRPTITLDTATSTTVTISATGVTVQNLLFKANFADIVTVFNVTAKDAAILNCEFQDTATDMNFLSIVKATSTSDNNADGLTVEGCRWVSPDAAGLEFVEVNANLNRLLLKDNHVTCVAATACPLILVAGTKVLSGARIVGNTIQNGNTANDLLIDNGGSTGQSGLVAYNLIGNLDVTGAQLGGAATGLQFFENYYTSTSTDSGAIAPAADTPLS